MSANFGQLLVALENIEKFSRELGVAKDAEAFQKLRRQLEARKSSKSLEEAVFKARGVAAFSVTRLIAKQPWDTEKKKLKEKEFFRLRQELDDALMPPEPAFFPETEIQGLADNDEFTKVWGDPKEAKAIAGHAMDTVNRFSAAVFGDDIETAYGLCANELRGWMSVKRFITELDKADRQYGGKAVKCKIERVAHIEADAISREKSGNSRGNWPKDTPKSNKRATIGAFWFTKPEENRGRWVFFWITEEADGYRIAKFTQYLQ